MLPIILHFVNFSLRENVEPHYYIEKCCHLSHKMRQYSTTTLWLPTQNDLGRRFFVHCCERKL